MSFQSELCSSCQTRDSQRHSVAAILDKRVISAASKLADISTSLSFLATVKWSFFGASVVALALRLFVHGEMIDATLTVSAFCGALAWWQHAQIHRRARLLEDFEIDTLGMARAMGFLITATQAWTGVHPGVSLAEKDAHPVLHARWHEVDRVEDIALIVIRGKTSRVLRDEWIAKDESLTGKLRRWLISRRGDSMTFGHPRPPRDPTIL